MKNAMPGIEELRKYVVETFKLDSLPDERIDEIVDKFSLAFSERVALSTLERLGREDAAEFDRLVASQASEDAIREFLESRIPDYNDLVRGIAENFIKELRSGIPSDPVE